MSIGIAIGLYVVLREADLPILPRRRDLLAVDRGWLATFGLSSLLGLALRLVRWRWQLAPIAHVPLGRVLSANMLGNAALVTLPLRMGEFVRPSLIARTGRVSFAAAAGTTVSERLIDMLLVGSLMLGCLTSAPATAPPRDDWLSVSARVVPMLGYLASAIALSVAAAIALFYAFRTSLTALVKRSVGRVAPRAGRWLETQLLDACRGVSFLTTGRWGIPFLLFSVLFWGTFWLGTFAILRAAGIPELSPARAGVVAGTLALGLASPSAPGFFGSFQVATYSSLALFYSTETITRHAAVSVFWLYVAHVGLGVAMVPIGLWLERRSRHPSASRASRLG